MHLSSCYKTDLGALFAGDCLHILPQIQGGVADVVFADPPFNLGKTYGPSTDDRMSDEANVSWCTTWITECVRILKPGGALFLYNLPKWNMILGGVLSQRGLAFRQIVEEHSRKPEVVYQIIERLYPGGQYLELFARHRRPGWDSFGNQVR